MAVKTKKMINKIKQAIDLVNQNQYRPIDDKGRPGGLLDFSKLTQLPIIVGDLHGSYENIYAIVHHEDNLKRFKSGKAILIILGDAVHNDQTGEMLEMESSLKTIEYVFDLFDVLKENVVYIRGNHDTFDERLRKSGIAQGLEFKNYLIEKRSQEYMDMVEKFFVSLPLFIIGKGYVITHAGPVRRGCTRQELININDDQDKYWQLTWNRLHEFRGNPNNREYDGEDIKATLRKLKLPEDTPFIVGHNPMWHTGDTTGVWQDVLGIKNHHIIYTNKATLAPYLVVDHKKVIVKFARQA